jgi:hypothetical protein
MKLRSRALKDAIALEHQAEQQAPSAPCYDANVQACLATWMGDTRALEANLSSIAMLKAQLAMAEQATPALKDAFYLSGDRYGASVQISSNGDPVQMARAGVPVKQEATHGPTLLVAPVGLLLTLGKLSGDVIPTWKPVKHALHYVLQESVVDPPTPATWVTRDSRARRGKALHGLPPGQRAWVRLAVVTAGGQSPWCEPVSVVVR